MVAHSVLPYRILSKVAATTESLKVYGRARGFGNLLGRLLNEKFRGPGRWWISQRKTDSLKSISHLYRPNENQSTKKLCEHREVYYTRPLHLVLVFLGGSEVNWGIIVHLSLWLDSTCKCTIRSIRIIACFSSTHPGTKTTASFLSAGPGPVATSDRPRTLFCKYVHLSVLVNCPSILCRDDRICSLGKQTCFSSWLGLISPSFKCVVSTAMPVMGHGRAAWLRTRVTIFAS